MDYAGMAQRLGQFRQAQVPGGGQRPMTMGQGMGGMMGQMPQQAQGALSGAMNRAQGMMPQGMQGMAPQAMGLAGAALQSQGRPNPYMTSPGINPMQAQMGIQAPGWSRRPGAMGA